MNFDEVPPVTIPHTNPTTWPEIRAGRLASLIEHTSPEGCRIGLLGVPDDHGVSLNGGRVGAQGGPRVFREALARYGTPFYQPESRDLSTVKIFDAGDLVIGDDLESTHERLTEAVKAMLGHGMLPVVIGGGHDLTWPGVRGLSEHLGEAGNGMEGVYLDAHLDVREERGSGMPFRRILESTPCAKLTVVGLDPFANSREHVEWFRANRGEIGQRDLSAESFFASRSNTAMFVSIDMDAVSSAFAPGVSAVNPVGLAPETVEAWAFHAGRSSSVKYMDLMEFNPAYDTDGRTARVAARLFLAVVAGFAGRDD